MALYSSFLDKVWLGEQLSASLTGCVFAGGGGTSTATRATGSFLTDGFRPGDLFTVSGTTTGTNDGAFKIASVTATVLTLTADLFTNQTSDATMTLQSKGLVEIIRNGILVLWSGSMPTSGDAAETGSALIKFTVDGGAFTAGSSTNALTLDIADGVISKPSDETWEGEGIAAGTANYAAWYDNAYDTGEDPDGARIYMDVGTTSGEVQVAGSRVISVGSPEVIKTVTIVFS